jgi:hypothetical protein
MAKLRRQQAERDAIPRTVIVLRYASDIAPSSTFSFVAPALQKVRSASMGWLRSSA